MHTNTSGNSTTNNIGRFGPVDAAVILVRHYKLFLGTFFALVFVWGGLLFLQDERYEYVSLLEVGESAPDSAIESPASLVSIMQGHIWPEVLDKHYGERTTGGLRNLDVSNDRGTRLIRIATVANRQASSTVVDLHEGLVEAVLSRHAKIKESAKNSLRNRLEQIEGEINSIQSNAQNSQALSALYATRAQLRESFEALSDTTPLVVARMQPYTSGKSTFLISVVLFFMSLIVCLFLVFFVEFARLVQAKVREEG